MWPAHSRPGLSLEDILTAVLDATIAVTRTERGVLLLADPSGALQAAVARNAQRGNLRTDEVQVSQGVVKRVSSTRRELIISETEEGSGLTSQQESMARLALRTIVAIPIDKLPVIEALDATISARQGGTAGNFVPR